MSILLSGKQRPGWLPYAFALLGGIILSWFVAYNGWPVVYEDTSSYLSRPARVLAELGVTSEWNPLADPHALQASDSSSTSDSAFQSAKDNPVWFGGRSVYYGTLMVLASVVGTTYMIAFLQAYLCALAVAIPWFRLGLGPLGYLAVLAVLSVAAGLAVIVATLMPDIFAPIAILTSATLLVLWRDLTVTDRVVLTAILCFAALSHNSILALVLAACVACGIALLFKQLRPEYRRFVPIWAGGVAGLAGLLVFSITAEMVSGRPPLDLPHLSAKVATTEEGRMVLSEHCPELQLAVCRYQRQLEGGDWISFMFDSDEEHGVFAPASLETKYALSDEQAYVLYLVAREEPALFVTRQIGDIAGMLANFSLADFDVTTKTNLARTVAPEVMAKVRETRTYRDGGRSLATLSLLMQITVIASSAIVVAALALRWSRRTFTQADVLALFLLVGVVANAVICATLAGVYDRFQARVIWLVPLAAALVILQARQSQGKPQAAV